MKGLYKSIFSFLAIIIVLAGLGLGAKPASADGGLVCTEYHTVQRGEYLVKIANMYGVSWRWLADINDLVTPSKIYPGQKLCVAVETGSTTPTPPTFKIPTFSIKSVVKNETVTINTSNFPANTSFAVLMGKMGTRGVNGIKVDTIASGSGGSFTKTFQIPSELEGLSQIAIRLEATNGSGYFAYNWFYNNTAGSGSGSNTGGGTVPGGYTGIPTFSIQSVVADQSVTIKTNNFPANKTWAVLMGKMGTRGVNGVQVATIDSGSGGSFSSTFQIPTALMDQSQIAIRLQATDGSGYYAYNWFWNNTAP